MHPVEFRRIIHDAHDTIAPTYGALSIKGGVPERSLAHWNHMTNVEAPVTAIVRRHVQASSFTLLDAGCGNGQLFHLYAQLGARRIYGVDFSWNMLRHAENRAGANDIAFTPVQSQLEQLAFIKDSPFDLINCYGVIEHLADPRQVLAELIRVLAPRGLLIVGIPRKGSLAWLTYALFHGSLEPVASEKCRPGYSALRRKMAFYRFFSKNEIQELLLSLNDVRVVDRLSVAHGGILGPPARILEKMANRGRYDLIDRWNHLARISGLIPAGEYVALRKHAG